MKRKGDLLGPPVTAQLVKATVEMALLGSYKHVGLIRGVLNTEWASILIRNNGGVTGVLWI